MRANAAPVNAASPKKRIAGARRVAAIAAFVLAAPTALFGQTSRSVSGTVQSTGGQFASCAPVAGTFAVPAGSTASGFSLEQLVAGNNCGTGSPIQTRGFSITRLPGMSHVFDYAWSPGGNGQPLEGPVRLTALVLGPGSYQVWVNGGIGAIVTLRYSLGGGGTGGAAAGTSGTSATNAQGGSSSISQSPSAAFSGSWASEWGKMALTQSGAKLSGTFAFKNGRISAQVQGGTAVGYWMQDSSGRRCDSEYAGTYYWGQGRWTLSPDGRSFSGLWGYCNDAPSSAWAGRRTGTAGQTVSTTFAGSAGTSRLVSGAYRVATGGYRAVFNLTVSGNQIAGTAKWDGYSGIDPLRGTIDGDKLTLQRDCRPQSGVSPCAQTWSGTIRGNAIEGTETGTGGTYSWTLQL